MELWAWRRCLALVLLLSLVFNSTESQVKIEMEGKLNRMDMDLLLGMRLGFSNFF